MGTFMVKVISALMQLALLIGQWSTNITCFGEYYQPKIPEEMLNKIE